MGNTTSQGGARPENGVASEVRDEDGAEYAIAPMIAGQRKVWRPKYLLVQPPGLKQRQARDEKWINTPRNCVPGISIGLGPWLQLIWL